jgi:hypothetical protein
MEQTTLTIIETTPLQLWLLPWSDSMCICLCLFFVLLLSTIIVSQSIYRFDINIKFIYYLKKKSLTIFLAILLNSKAQRREWVLHGTLEQRRAQ